MSSLTLLAQQYLPISPRHVSLVTLDSGDPSAVVAASAAFDPQRRVYFVEWDDPSEASSFRVSHVSVPGSRSSSVTALALTVDAAGVVHCVVHVRGGVAHVYRRHTLQDDHTRTVRYVRLPCRPCVGDARPWTAATRLCRSDGGAGRMAIACGGSGGETNVLRLLRLTGSQLSLQRTVELPALAGFPVLQLREMDGDAAAVLALCHHAVVEVDTRLPCEDAVVRAWRWSPHDPLTSFTLRDNVIAAGTEDGVVVLWDMRQTGAVDHSAPCGAPVTGLHMPHRTSLLSCHADGTVFAWDQRHTQQGQPVTVEEKGSGFAFAAQRVSALPPVFVGSPGCAGLAAEDGIAVVADESGTLSIFAVP